MNITNEEILLTETGAERIRSRIDWLERKMAEDDQAIDELIGSYGYSDELYHDRLSRKELRMRELIELRSILEHSRTVEVSDVSAVQIGNVVKLTNHMACYIFQIVSTLEVDPLNGKVSANSPIGSAIVGRKVGEVVKISLPSGELELKIDNIE